MGLACPECGRNYDVTLFEFGRKVKCECGSLVTLESGHIRLMRNSPDECNLPPTDKTPTDGNETLANVD